MDEPHDRAAFPGDEGRLGVEPSQVRLALSDRRGEGLSPPLK